MARASRLEPRESAERPDYDEEARKLFAALNLTPGGAANDESSRLHSYRNLDIVWRHPTTGARGVQPGGFGGMLGRLQLRHGTCVHGLDFVRRAGAQVFIGNATASSQKGILQKNRITHIVNCTSDMVNALEGDPSIAYYRFDLYKFFATLDLRSTRGVLEFFLPVFQWIDAAVNSGQSVLIHCLAGAHRAGTTGVAYVMHAADLDHQTAIAACKRCRPVVDPIGDLTNLLAQLDLARQQRKIPASHPAA
ncbi:unnamed protein product [Durusdinium trenchii]|uniref:protein-tyrosine-phosphatase n=1 Tax=Durusdinium trenchii TaxID=1381693 RepID=A0ABP0RA38_9DINO